MGNSCDNDWRCPFVGLDGGDGGVHSGPCQKTGRPHVSIRIKTGQQKILRAAIEEKKSRTGTARRSKKKKQRRRRSDNPLFLQCLVERLAVFLSFFP